MIANKLSKITRGFMSTVGSRCICSSQSTDKYDYDVVIVGGGMVGGAMACALGKNPFLSDQKVLLLEASPESSEDILRHPPAKQNNRVVAISPGNVKFLRSLGIWEKLPRYKDVMKMQVWDAYSDAVLSFKSENETDELCTIVENNLIVAGLYEELENLQDIVEVRYGSRITSCQAPPKNDTQNTPAIVKLVDGTNIRTKLLIAADGANSLVAKILGMRKLMWDYNQCAVVATLQYSEPSDNVVAWQRFLPTGPIAMLPLSDDRSSLVWSTTPEHAHQLVAMSEDELAASINRAYWQDYPKHPMVATASNIFRSFLSSGSVLQLPPSVTAVLGKQQLFPLRFGHANEYVRSGVALIGDAAHQIHPQAGQGVNLGWRDVDCLSEKIAKAIYNGQYIGALPHLLEYESAQQKSNLPILLGVDMFKWLFSNDNPALLGLRGAVLSAVDTIGPIKDIFMERAKE